MSDVAFPSGPVASHPSDPSAQGSIGGTYVATVFAGSRAPDSGSLVGDLIVFKQMETGDAPFAVDQAAVTVVGPATTVSPAVTIAPGGTALTQVLQAIVPESIGGTYDVLWEYQASGQTVMRSERYFVAWHDLYTPVRRLMQVDNTIVQNYDVDVTVAQIMNTLLDPFIFGSSVTAYSVLPAQDRDAFDRALALLAAAWLRPFMPRQTPTGAVLRWTSGTDTYQWQAQPLKPNQQTVEEMWIDAAWELLTTTSLIGPQMRAMQHAQVAMRTSGKRRNRQSPFLNDSFGNVYPNPAFMLWHNWLEFGRGIHWSWSDGALL